MVIEDRGTSIERWLAGEVEGDTLDQELSGRFIRNLVLGRYSTLADDGYEMLLLDRFLGEWRDELAVSAQTFPGLGEDLARWAMAEGQVPDLEATQEKRKFLLAAQRRLVGQHSGLARVRKRETLFVTGDERRQIPLEAEQLQWSRLSYALATTLLGERLGGILGRAIVAQALLPVNTVDAVTIKELDDVQQALKTTDERERVLGRDNAWKAVFEEHMVQEAAVWAGETVGRAEVFGLFFSRLQKQLFDTLYRREQPSALELGDYVEWLLEEAEVRGAELSLTHYLAETGVFLEEALVETWPGVHDKGGEREFVDGVVEGLLTHWRSPQFRGIREDYSNCYVQPYLAGQWQTYGVSTVRARHSWPPNERRIQKGLTPLGSVELMAVPEKPSKIRVVLPDGREWEDEMGAEDLGITDTHHIPHNSWEHYVDQLIHLRRLLLLHPAETCARLRIGEKPNGVNARIAVTRSQRMLGRIDINNEQGEICLRIMGGGYRGSVYARPLSW